MLETALRLFRERHPRRLTACALPDRPPLSIDRRLSAPSPNRRRPRDAMTVVAALLLTVLSLVPLACKVRSPILLFEGASKTNPNRLRVKAGIKTIRAALLVRGEPVSKVFTFNIPPIYFLYALHPKEDELEFVEDCLLQYFVDNDVFEFVYPFPFNPRHVGAVLTFDLKKIENRNTRWYSIPLQIPYINYLTLLLPMERFTAEYDIALTVSLPNGKILKRYPPEGQGFPFPQKRSDWVWIYEQPYGDYVWYKSVFRAQFLTTMAYFRECLERDKQEIEQAVEEYNRTAR